MSDKGVSDKKVRITIDFKKYYGSFVNVGQIGIFEGWPITTRENFMNSGNDFIFVAMDEPNGKIIPFNLNFIEKLEFLDDDGKVIAAL